MRSILRLSTALFVLVCCSAAADASAVTITFTGDGSGRADVAVPGAGGIPPFYLVPKGGCPSTQNPCTVATTGPAGVAATPDRGSTLGAIDGCAPVPVPFCAAIGDITIRFDALTPHTLTVARNAAARGDVSSDFGGIDCGSACSAVFYEGETVTLTATPTAGNVFTGWDGCSSADNTCTVAMNDAKDVTANFAAAPSQHTLTVVKNGTGSVTSDPAGIDCGDTCTSTMTDGQTITLTATSAADYALWTGCATHTATTCTVKLTANHEVDVSFISNYSITYSQSGDGNGHVTFEFAPGISFSCDDPGVCTPGGNFVTGSPPSYTFTEQAEPGSTFVGWSGTDCTEGTQTGAACTIVADGDTTLNAEFAKTSVPLSVAFAGTGDGGVTTDDGTIDCTTAAPAAAGCSHDYDPGSTVVLKATADAGSTFDSFSGPCAETSGATCTVTLDQAVDVTAKFVAGPRTLTVVAGRGGSVTSEPVGIDCSGATGVDGCAVTRAYGTTFVLTAVPRDGATFDGWTGCDGAPVLLRARAVPSPTCTVTLNGHRTVTADFSPAPPTSGGTSAAAPAATATATASPVATSSPQPATLSSIASGDAPVDPAATVRRHHRAFVVRVHCGTTACVGAATATLRFAGQTLGSFGVDPASVTAGPGGAGSLRLALPATLRRALAAARRAHPHAHGRVRITVSFMVGDGSTRTHTFRQAL